MKVVYIVASGRSANLNRGTSSKGIHGDGLLHADRMREDDLAAWYLHLLRDHWRHTVVVGVIGVVLRESGRFGHSSLGEVRVVRGIRGRSGRLGMHRQLLVIQIHGHVEDLRRRDKVLETVPGSGNVDGDLGLEDLDWRGNRCRGRGHH